MRLLLGVFLALSMQLIAATADENSVKEKALAAVSFFSALVVECGAETGQPNIQELAKEDGEATLVAGGYPAGEARRAVGEIFAALQAGMKPTGMAAPMCAGLAKNILAGREAFRASLSQ